MTIKEEFKYMVYVDDKLQELNENYDICGDNIVFKTAPIPNSKIKIYKIPIHKDKNA